MMDADLNANFFDVLRIHAAVQPNHPAIDDGERVITYQQLDLVIDQGAANLRKIGIKTGDVVALMLGNNAANLVLSGVIGRAGGVLFSLGRGMKRAEIEGNLKDAGALVLITDIAINGEIGVDTLSPGDILRDRGVRFDGSAPGGDNPFVLVQTSGTTGKPKMFHLSHGDLICRSVRQCEMVGVTQSERITVSNHMGFFTSRVHYCYILRAGATAVIANFASADEFLSSLLRNNVNHLRLVAAELIELLRLSSEGKLLLPGLRMLAVAGAPITANQRQAARNQLSPNFVEQYASNETGVLAYADTAGQIAYPDAVGRIVDGVEAQIVDEIGAEKPAGEVGFVRFKGQDFPDQYLNNHEATAKAFKDGWYYPGDLARINEDGYLFLLGRADDIINNAGIKFYPVEVEGVLLSHPAVTEAAVFAWPHKIAGKVAAAAVVVEGNVTYEQLKEYCSERLAGYKLPYVIAFRKTLPKNAMGKVLKRNLVAQMQAQMQSRSETSNDV